MENLINISPNPSYLQCHTLSISLWSNIVNSARCLSYFLAQTNGELKIFDCAVWPLVNILISFKNCIYDLCHITILGFFFPSWCTKAHFFTLSFIVQIHPVSYYFYILLHYLGFLKKYKLVFYKTAVKTFQ